MTEPLQLSVPEHAQINIYVAAAPLFAQAAPPAPEDGHAAKPASRPLSKALVALLLFGLGYGAHGLASPQASAEADQPARTDFPVMPAPPRPPPLLSAPRQGAALAPAIRAQLPQPVGSPVGGPRPPASIGLPAAPVPSGSAAVGRSPFGLN